MYVGVYVWCQTDTGPLLYTACVCVRDAVSDLALHFLAKMKIMVVKDVEREDIEFICKVSQWLHVVQHRGWLSSRVVSMLDSGTEGPGFISQP